MSEPIDPRRLHDAVTTTKDELRAAGAELLRQQDAAIDALEREIAGLFQDAREGDGDD